MSKFSPSLQAAIVRPQYYITPLKIAVVERMTNTKIGIFYLCYQRTIYFGNYLPNNKWYRLYKNKIKNRVLCELRIVFYIFSFHPRAASAS